ncbi:MAG: hypothetical protein ACRET2_02210 [Steroidobacteraceae bacterium]
MSAHLIERPKVIPRHARVLNELAEQAGMAVAVCVERDAEDSRLVSIWQGTKAQLRAVGLLSPGLLKMLDFHSHCCDLVLPPGERPQCNPLMYGTVEIDGDNICWRIDGGPATYSLREQGEVEIVTYADTVLFHGSAAALIGAGIDRKRLPTGQRTGRRKYCPESEPEWRCRRQPDGRYVYVVESQSVFERRCAGRTAPAPEPSLSEWKELVRERTEREITGFAVRLDVGITKGRFRLPDGVAKQLWDILAAARDELTAAIDAAHPTDSTKLRPQLRLVVGGKGY